MENFTWINHLDWNIPLMFLPWTQTVNTGNLSQIEGNLLKLTQVDQTMGLSELNLVNMLML